MRFLRPLFSGERILSCAQTSARPDGAWTTTAGLVLVRQRPGKGNAIFITLEDETGITNVLLWARVFERFRREVMGARLIAVAGRVQRSTEGVVHLMGERVQDRTAELERLTRDGVDIGGAPADTLVNPRHSPGMRHPRDVRIIPKSRDFH